MAREAGVGGEKEEKKEREGEIKGEREGPPKSQLSCEDMTVMGASGGLP